MRQEIVRKHCSDTTKYKAFYDNQSAPEQSTLRRGSRMKPITWAIREVLSSKPPPCKVLDIGCLHGTIELVLASLWYDVTAIDIVETFIEESKKNTKVVNDWIQYKLLPVEELFKVGNTFSVILCLSVFEHVANFDVAFNAIDSVADNGTVVLAIVPINNSWLTEEHTRVFTEDNLYDYFPKDSEITKIHFSNDPSKLGWFAIKYVVRRR